MEICKRMYEALKEAGQIKLKTYPTEVEKVYLSGWAMGFASRARDLVQMYENSILGVQKNLEVTNDSDEK